MTAQGFNFIQGEWCYVQFCTNKVKFPEVENIFPSSVQYDICFGFS